MDTIHVGWESYEYEIKNDWYDASPKVKNRIVPGESAVSSNLQGSSILFLKMENISANTL